MSSRRESAQRWVKCPACRQPALYGPDNPSRPFCSARCRNHDLGAWASEGYRVASQAPSDSDGPPDGGEVAH